MEAELGPEAAEGEPLPMVLSLIREAEAGSAALLALLRGCPGVHVGW